MISNGFRLCENMAKGASLGKIIDENSTSGFICNFSRYLVDCSWFKQWKEFVGYDIQGQWGAADKRNNPGPINNSPLLKGESSKLINFFHLTAKLIHSYFYIYRKHNIFIQGMIISHSQGWKDVTYLINLRSGRGAVCKLLCMQSNMDNVRGCRGKAVQQL